MARRCEPLASRRRSCRSSSSRRRCRCAAGEGERSRCRRASASLRRGEVCASPRWLDVGASILLPVSSYWPRGASFAPPRRASAWWRPLSAGRFAGASSVRRARRSSRSGCVPCWAYRHRLDVTQRWRASLLCCDTANRYRRRSRLTVSVSITTLRLLESSRRRALLGKSDWRRSASAPRGAGSSLRRRCHRSGMLLLCYLAKWRSALSGVGMASSSARQSHSNTRFRHSFPLRSAKPRAPAPPVFFPLRHSYSSTKNSFSSHHSAPSSLAHQRLRCKPMRQ